jgi:hypothetical protein
MAPSARNRWRLGPEIRSAATLILLFLIAQLPDQWTFHHFTFRGIYESGWGRMLRLAGYLPLWSIVALALVLHDWVPRALPTLRRASRRGLLLFWSAALGGIIAELLKIAMRRERPGLTNGGHVFRSGPNSPCRPLSSGCRAVRWRLHSLPRRPLPVCFPIRGFSGMRSPSDARSPGSQAAPIS